MSNPATAAPARPNSPSSNQRRCSHAVVPYKPILKHRSISELLTSELPVTSPIFSPIDSEAESETTDITSGDGSISLHINPMRPALLHTKSDTLVTRWGSSRTFRKGSPSRVDSPEVTHGSQHRSAFPSQLLSAGGAVRASHSQDSNSSEKSATSGSEHSQSRHKKKHISFNTFVEQCIAIDKPKKNASGYFGAISEASFMDGHAPWVDETGFAQSFLSPSSYFDLLSYRYEEDQEDSEDDEKVYVHCLQWSPDCLESGGARAIREDSDSPGEEEEDDDDDPIEIRSTSSRSTSTLRPNKKPLLRSHSKVSTTSSSSSASTSTTSSSRSNASTLLTTDTTSPSGSLSPCRRISSSSSIPRKDSLSILGDSRLIYRRSSTTTLMSTYRPSLHRIPRSPMSRSPESRPHHVTIAPIAPTLLKTTPTPWTENLGDDGSASSDDTFTGWAWGVGGNVDVVGSTKDERERDGGIQRRRSWTSGYGADGYGFAPGAFGTGRGMEFAVTNGAVDLDEHESDGTPVELVYVPPFAYDFPDEADVEFDKVEGSRLEEERVRIGGNTEILVEDIKVVGSSLKEVYSPSIRSVMPSSLQSARINGKSSVPAFIVDEGPSRSSFSIRDRQRLPTIEDEELEQDPYDYFGGPDMGDDYYYYSRKGGGGHEYSTTETHTSRGKSSNPKSSFRTNHAADRRREEEKNSPSNGDEMQSRGRSRSHSRTPSPALLSSHNDLASPPVGNESCADGGKNKSASGSAANGLLAATSPSRTYSQSDLLPVPARGRQLDASRPLNGIPSQQEERRGRSAARASSSSSWDRERGSSGSLTSTSPMGSLSPDGLDDSRRPGPALRAVLGGGRGEKEKDRETETGRERRGRDRKSSKVLSVVTFPADQSVGTKSLNTNFASAASSSSSASSNASTIMPKQMLDEENSESAHVRLAHELVRKRATPTSSNPPLLGSNSRTHIAPTMSSDLARVDMARTPTPTDLTVLPTASSTSPPSIRSSSKFRPPLTLRPAPPSPSKPSTAVVSPTVSAAPLIIPHIASVGASHAENTIVGKAVDIVSTAGMYLGLWRSTSAPSSPL